MRGVSLVAAPPATDLTVTKIDRVTVEVPFRVVPERKMARELPHWKYSEICTVHLQSGHQGHGETLLYYTWGATSDEDVQRALGTNAASLMWDDSLGAGLQMALFDAVARARDVPIHRLLGAQVPLPSIGANIATRLRASRLWTRWESVGPTVHAEVVVSLFPKQTESAVARDVRRPSVKPR